MESSWKEFDLDAYAIWARVDGTRKEMTLLEICDSGGIAYQKIRDQRSKCRMPSLRDLYVMSRILGVTVDYLISGEGAQPMSREARLVEEDLEMRALVRAVDRDRRLLSAVSAVVMSYEDTGIQKA